MHILLLSLLACTGKDAVDPDDTATPTDDTATDDTATDDTATDDTGDPVDVDGDGSPASEDCDDSDPLNFPGNPELCDGQDNDCDGEVDVDATDAATWYADRDEDGFGDPDTTKLECSQPSGYIGDDGDCNDFLSSINPDAPEICDADDTDEDCDGAADDDDDSTDTSTMSTWYADSDGDGYGDPDSSSLSCDGVGDVVDNDEDCDDGDPGANPDLGCGWDGTYTGDFAVTGSAALGTDDCIGTGEVEVATTDSPMITGTITCTFAGDLSFLGSQTVDIEGDIASDDSLSGTLTVGSIVSDSWRGSIGGDPAQLDGVFSGTGSYGGYAVVYSGEFLFER